MKRRKLIVKRPIYPNLDYLDLRFIRDLNETYEIEFSFLFEEGLVINYNWFIRTNLMSSIIIEEKRR